MIKRIQSARRRPAAKKRSLPSRRTSAIPSNMITAATTAEMISTVPKSTQSRYRGQFERSAVNVGAQPPSVEMASDTYSPAPAIPATTRARAGRPDSAVEQKPATDREHHGHCDRSEHCPWQVRNCDPARHQTAQEQDAVFDQPKDLAHALNVRSGRACSGTAPHEGPSCPGGAEQRCERTAQAKSNP